jgi:hypothetical protein
MHLETLTLIGAFDFILVGIALEIQQRVKVSVRAGIVGAQKGLATTKEKGQIVSHIVSLSVSAWYLYQSLL